MLRADACSPAVGATLRRRLARCGARLLIVAGLACLSAPQSAAGPWEGATAQGLTVRVTQDLARTREAYVLERRYPDGSLDATFGQHGTTLFSLGPDLEGPAALRLDALGRAWIAGATAGTGDTLQAVLLRFLSNGLPDASFGDSGRLVHAPAGRRARALDVAPLGDGGCLVAGTVIDASGAERSGWWRLGPDGRVDTRFGLGGLWVDTGVGSTEIVDLASAADGSAALVLRRGDGSAASLESWIVPSGASAPSTGPRAVADRGLRLVWLPGGWRWIPNGMPNAGMPGAQPGMAGVDTAPTAAASQPGTRVNATSQAPAPAPSSPPLVPGRATALPSLWWWLGLALAAPAVGWWLARRRGKNLDGNAHPGC